MAKETTVKAKYLRISPKKVKLLLREFSGLSIEEALEVCQSSNRKPFGLVAKLINSGQAAAEEQGLDQDNLKIKEIICQQGPTLKRRLFRSRGRADVIRKRTIHLVLRLIEKPEKEKRKKKKKGKKK